LQFTLSTVQGSSGQFSVTVTGPASAAVTLDTSSDLSTWTPGYAAFTLSGSGSFAYTDTSATPSARFFRASISSSGQQSCNVVGYVDRTMPLGTSMHCNPFNTTDRYYTRDERSGAVLSFRARRLIPLRALSKGN